MFAYFCGVVVAGMSGSSFWLAAGTEHFTYLSLLMWGLAMVPTGTQAPTSSRNGPDGIGRGLHRYGYGPSDGYVSA